MVKVGIRRRSFKKSFSARTKGRATRSIKRAFIPGYGKRGAGWAHPRRKLYNKVYNKTTIDLRTVGKPHRHHTSTRSAGGTSMNKTSNTTGCIWLFVILFGIALLVTYWYVFLAIAVLGGAIGYYIHQKHRQAADAQAEQDARRADEERQQELDGTKVDQIRRFKELFDEGAITQEEFDQQKQRILEDKHDHDDLEF
jgi:hypothetical protein